GEFNWHATARHSAWTTNNNSARYPVASGAGLLLIALGATSTAGASSMMSISRPTQSVLAISRGVFGLVKVKRNRWGAALRAVFLRLGDHGTRGLMMLRLW